jgi:hypothetical protein
MNKFEDLNGQFRTGMTQLNKFEDR